MANDENVRTISIPAAADLSAKQFLFCKMTSTGVNVAGVGDFVIGVLYSGASAVSSQPEEVAFDGAPKVKCGGTVAPGGLVKCDTNGAAVAATLPGDAANVIGVSVSLTSRASGEYVRILLLPR